MGFWGVFGVRVIDERWMRALIAGLWTGCKVRGSLLDVVVCMEGLSKASVGCQSQKQQLESA